MHHRGALSLRENRQRLGHAAYHWGILISPKTSTGRDCHTYDVTNGIRMDPVTNLDLNPEYDWYFRAQDQLDPTLVSNLLGMVMIGKVPERTEYADIQARLEAIALPRKGDIPEENCVSWARCAVEVLQRNGLVEEFDIDGLMDDALAYADQRIRGFEHTPDVINYTGRPI